MTLPNSLRTGPDEHGRFGIHGGRFVAETLMPLILELEQAYEAAKRDPAFDAELQGWFKDYVGRPSPLYFAERLTEHLGGAKIYFKRDELNHTGAHKINNVLGQMMLARRMGKKRIIAETGAGQHGVATATVAARFGLECIIYMGERDIERQQPNVFRMRLLGAEVRPVSSGSRTLKDSLNEALRDWVSNPHDTFYVIGTVAGPHPYPAMVRDFQSVIGTEAREQILAKEGRLPDALVAAVGGGSNAMGLFHPFLDDRDVRIVAVEAGGHGIASGEHAAAMTAGRPGILHGQRSYLLQDEDGQVIEPHSISAGLDYPGIGPGAGVAQGHRPDRDRVDHRRRGAGRVLAVRAPRGHPAGAGAEPCDRSGREAGADAGQGPDHRDEFLRPRRQGRADHRADHGGRAVSGRIGARFAELREAGRAGLVTFLTAGDPDHETSFALLAGPARGRCRPDRDRHAVHRPDGGWAGDPGREPARAGGRGADDPHAGAGARASGPPTARRRSC